MSRKTDAERGRPLPDEGMAAISAQLLRALGNILMPPLCIGCHEPLGTHHTLCAKCWNRIDFIRPPLCDRLGIPMPFDTGGAMISAGAAANPPDYDRARAVARFEGPMRDLIHDFKFRDQQTARTLFGRWLSEVGRDLMRDTSVVVPVPLNRLRLLKRRYNQAALLAQELARTQGLTYEPRALVRTRRTAPQVGLSHSERRKNVSGAFAVPNRRRRSVDGRSVLLVDDVITTGATVDAAARCLKRAGATSVDVLVLALAVGAN